MAPRYTPDHGESLIGIGHAAHLLGVHSDTLRRWTDENKITAVRTAGGHRRYRLADVLALRGTA